MANAVFSSDYNHGSLAKSIMIDLVTGKIELDGVVIGPNFVLNDFTKYGSEKINIFTRGNGRGIIRFTNLVNNNGVNAQIKIEINEKLNLRRVIITPSLKELDNMTLLDASKLWLKGIANGNYDEDEDSISGRYTWGYITAQYMEDRDYGTIGGEIIVNYGEL